MTRKPDTAAGYRSDQVALVRATALYVASVLGDLLDEVTVVGGLVPSLLIPQEALPAGVERHVGTLDLDLGLSLGLLDGGRYQELAERLRQARFAPDTNVSRRRTRQRWCFEDAGRAATVDFLIAPSGPQTRPGRLFNLEKDLAAIITPGLPLAFRDRDKITLAGLTILGEQATRGLWVCGPGAYVALKALAFEGRGENKDAYDLYYVLRSYGRGVEDVAARFRPFRDESAAIQALGILTRDFREAQALGPQRVARFLAGVPDPVVQADVAGFVAHFLALCQAGAS